MWRGTQNQEDQISLLVPKQFFLSTPEAGKAWDTSAFSRFGPVYNPFLFLLKLRVSSNTTSSILHRIPTPTANTLRLSPVPFNMVMCVWKGPLGIVTFSFLAHNSLPVRVPDSWLNYQHFAAKPPLASMFSVLWATSSASDLVGSESIKSST